MLQCNGPELAQFRPAEVSAIRSLLGDKRTFGKQTTAPPSG